MKLTTPILGATLCLASLSVTAPAHAFDRVYTEAVLEDISKIAWYDLTVWGGQQYTFETSDLSPISGCLADTVLHVIDRSNSTWIATNDDCGGSRRSCVTFTAPGGGGTSRTVRAIVHGYATCSRSTGTFTGTGYGLSFTRINQIFGGHVLSAPTEAPGWEDGDTFQAVRVMNGAPCSLSLVAWGFSSGTLRPAGWSFGGGHNGGAVLTTTGPAASTYSSKRIAVGTSAAIEDGGVARLYVNDYAADDADGDGLGDALEAELGTCGGTTCSSGNGNPIDTDGDGLPDALELLGDATNLLAFWGADPLHKDVFIEVDRHTGGNTLSATQVANVQAIYATGPTASLENPDDEDGLRLHVDNGASSCSGGVCSTLHGDWGGARPHSAEYDYIVSATEHMAESRRGVFRHALAGLGVVGGGKTKGWIIGFENGNTSAGMRAFAHELGHSLGITGHDGGNVGSFNCVPNYLSLMSYALAYADEVGFSEGGHIDLNPWALCEEDGIGGDPAVIENRYSLTVDGEGVDWNRDGDISDCNSPVQANIQWANAQGCNSVKAHETWEEAGAARGDQTGVAAFDDALVAVYRAGGTREIKFKAFTGDLTVCAPPQTEGCCPADGTGACGDWTAADDLGGGAVDSAPAAVRFAFMGSIPLIAVFYVKDDSGTPRIYRNVINEDLETGSPVSLSLSIAPLLDEDHPSVLGVVHYDTRIWVVYRAANDTLHQVLLNSALSVVSQGALVDSGSSTFSSGRAPSLAIDPDTSDLLAVITNPANQNLRLIRHVSGTTWEEVSGAWSTTLSSGGGPVGLVAAPSADPPSLSVWYVPTSTPAGRLHKAFTTTSLQFELNRLATHQWATDHRGSVGTVEWQGRVQAVANWYHEDLQGGETEDEKNNTLHHMPFADGVYDKDFHDSDDWANMRDGICPILRDAISGGTALCVPAGVNPSFQSPPEEICPTNE